MGLESILIRLLRPSPERIGIDSNPSHPPPENRIKINFNSRLAIWVQGGGAEGGGWLVQRRGVQRGGLVGSEEGGAEGGGAEWVQRWPRCRAGVGVQVQVGRGSLSNRGWHVNLKFKSNSSHTLFNFLCNVY